MNEKRKLQHEFYEFCKSDEFHRGIAVEIKCIKNKRDIERSLLKQEAFEIKQTIDFKSSPLDKVDADIVFEEFYKVDISRGKFKAYHIKMYYIIAQYIDWYCVGWPEEIIDLLRFCTHLGKNTGDGWGAVLRWEVTEWPEDWSIRGPQNKLMRAVPLQQDRNGFLYGLRPSYWNPRHQFICKMPQIN